jgi:hypothetical protein
LRAFDLLEWLVPKGEAFPRAFRPTVTARLLGAALDLAEQLLDAQTQRRAARPAGPGRWQPEQAPALFEAGPPLGAGCRTGSTSMSAAWWPRSAGSSAAGYARPAELNKYREAPRGSTPRRRLILDMRPHAPPSGVRTGRARAIHRPPPHPASRDRRDLPAFWRAKVDVGRAHHPKPDVVVAVVRTVVVAVAVVRARVVLIVVPGAPAQHPRLDHGTPSRFPGEHQRSRLPDAAGPRLKKHFPGRALRGHSDQRFSVQRGGTSTPPETR